MSKARELSKLPNYVLSTVAELKLSVGKEQGDKAFVGGYYADGDGGGGDFYWDAVSVETDNGGTIFQVTGTTTGRWKRIYSGSINVKWFGAKGDGITDDTVNICMALSFLADGMTLDFCGASYSIFNSISGVIAPTDATTLSLVPRLYNVSNITLQNGKLFASSPSVSATKYNYPTTLSIDRCSNITINNMILESKGESFGNTDASFGLGKIERAEYAQKNGGHALLVVRSKDVTMNQCTFRLAGSVGSFYSMSSHNATLNSCFSNPASLGYACYAFDSWAGNTTETLFPSHVAYMNNCSASKEGYTYGSKGCVITEDKDVSVIVSGGYFADAYPNGFSRDLGYAFGSSTSTTIVTNAVVENCASVGYSGTTTSDPTYLIIENIVATNIRKTVHQLEDTSVGTMYVKYNNCYAEVNDSGKWVADGDLTREESSFVALPNDGNKFYGSFNNCVFEGATYGFISTTVGYGKIEFNECELTTNGFLYDSKNIGSGSAGTGKQRGIYFNNCSITDTSDETGAYTTIASSVIYTNIDLSSSTIKLNTVRPIETSTISTPSTFIETYKFPRQNFKSYQISSTDTLLPDSAIELAIEPLTAARSVLLPRSDKYKYMEFRIKNTSSTYDLVVKDYLGTTTILTMAAGTYATFYGNGTLYNVK